MLQSTGHLAVLVLAVIVYAPEPATPLGGPPRSIEPCRFRDSLNVTGWPVAADGSVSLDGIRYAPALIGQFDYDLVNNTERQPAASHRRACVCAQRPCIRLRCGRGLTLDERHCRPDARLNELQWPVRMNDGQLQTVELFERFGYTVGKVCHQMMLLEPNKFPDDAWELHENGSVTTADRVYRQYEYNLLPAFNETTQQIQMHVTTCFEPADDEQEKYRYSLMPIGMLISVPFLIATFLVFAILPELRNVHGQSLMCYLLALSVGYTLLAYLQVNPSLSSPVCRPFAYTVYFMFNASFVWLNVISFDLWWNFRGVNGINRMKKTRKFIMYSAYGWGVPLFMVSLAFGMDASASVPASWQPGFGKERCFFKTDHLIELFYFYLPNMIIFVANATFFTLTALKIRRVQTEMGKITSKADSHKSQFDKEKAKYGLFLRLFIVMGVTWTMEAVSWLIDPIGWVFVLSDAMNCIQGLLIFVLFVLKANVKKLLIKRWKEWSGVKTMPRVNTSTTTQSTNITNISSSPENAMLMRSTSTNTAKAI